MADVPHEQLTAAFRKGIDKSFDPCPLIGEKWFRHYPSGKPAHFTVDCRKLAKAMGMKPHGVCKIILRHTDLRPFGATVRVSEKGVVHVMLPADENETAE
jgi:hypothetical protein